MYGIPRRLQTLADYERVHKMALAGQARPEEARRYWQGLLAGRQHYVFERTLEPGEEAPQAKDDVLVTAGGDGKRDEARRVLRLFDDPAARIAALGLDGAYVEQKIAQIDEVSNVKRG